MKKQSAGILVYRRNGQKVEVLLAHPGGPFWAKKDNQAWSIPKGEYQPEENPFVVAKREFEEETGQKPPEGEYQELGNIVQAGGKIVTAWAIEKDLGSIVAASNSFTMEWPPRSDQQQTFPEVDRVEWFDLLTATTKLHPGQDELVRRLATKLGESLPEQNSGPSETELNNQQISLL